jgi:hypothetical protein
MHVTILLNDILWYSKIKLETIEKYVHKHEFWSLPLFTFMYVGLTLIICQCFVKSWHTFIMFCNFFFFKITLRVIVKLLFPKAEMIILTRNITSFKVSVEYFCKWKYHVTLHRYWFLESKISDGRFLSNVWWNEWLRREMPLGAARAVPCYTGEKRLLAGWLDGWLAGWLG